MADSLASKDVLMSARLFVERKARLLLLVAVVAISLATIACEGTVYVGVGVAGPWGYGGPYGPYPPGGPVVVGYPY